MTKVVMIVQGIVLEGNLPEGISPEGAIQSGQTLELGRVNLIGMAVRTLPSMQIRTSDIAAISVSPVEGLELGPARLEQGRRTR